MCYQIGRISGVFSVLLVVASAHGQVTNKPKPKEKEKPPETATLTTKDFVALKCVYYPGINGKKTVPIILLHGWEGPSGAGSGRDCDLLAYNLQKKGHAVIVPDFRGHGESVYRRVPGKDDQLLNREKMRSTEFQSMAHDVEAVKRFLMKEHNAGQLNIELLCVVGFDMGAVVALNWVQYDWSVPPLPTLKQGQDVKAFVLVSPAQAFKGLPIRSALSDPIVRGQLSAMIVYGQQKSNVATAGRRIYNTLKRAHRPVPDDPDQRRKHQDLFLFELETSLQGTKLLARRELKLPDLIAEFVQMRLVNKRDDYPWVDRSRP